MSPLRSSHLPVSLLSALLLTSSASLAQTPPGPADPPKGPAGGTGDPTPAPTTGPKGPPAPPSPAPKGPAGGTSDPSPAVLTPPATPNPPPAPPHELVPDRDPAEDRIWTSLAQGLAARTGDGAFSIQLGLQTQFRFEASNSSDETRDANFVVRNVRPQIRGNVGLPWVRYFVQPELAGASARLLDLELDARPHEAIGLRLGQFLTPFSRDFFTPVPRKQFPDFSVANDYFRSDRDTGAMLYGTPFHDHLEYYLGVFNGNGINRGANDDKKVMYEGRLVVNPLGRVEYDEVPALASKRPFALALGVNAYHAELAITQVTADKTTGAATVTPTGATNKNNTAGADLAVRWERLALQGEVYWRRNDIKDVKSTSLGGYVQASAMVVDRVVELGGRLSYIDPDKDRSNDRVRVVEGLVTYYVSGHHLKLQARYANGHVDSAGVKSTSSSAMAINPGQTVHSLTLQTQLFF